MQANWNDMLESVAQANQKAVAAVAEFNKIATRTQGQLVRKQIEALETCLDAGTRHLQVVTETRDPKQALQLHTEVVVELGEKLVAATQASLEIQVQARDELARWMEDGIKSVDAKANGAAPVAPRRPARRARKAV